MDNASCVVITPFLNRIEPLVEIGLRELEKRGYTVWREFGISAIDFARSLLATRALDMSFSETLWIDSDVQFEPDQIEQMRRLTWKDLQSSLESAPKVVDAISRLQAEYELPGAVCGLYVKKSATGFTSSLPPLRRRVVFGDQGGPLLMGYVGTGMLLVRSWAYELVKKWHDLPVCTTSTKSRLVPYFLPMVIKEHNGDASYLCEDFAFCERLQAAGIPIFADTRVRLHHLGTYGFSWEDISLKVPRHSNIEVQID